MGWGFVGTIGVGGMAGLESADVLRDSGVSGGGEASSAEARGGKGVGAGNAGENKGTSESPGNFVGTHVLVGVFE